MEYFSELGQAAYLTVSELEARESADLYLELSAQFMTLQNILQAMRGGPIPLAKGLSPTELHMH